MDTSAVIDPTGTYRYRLTRSWDVAKKRVCFVMLNPSTADASLDDPTIRRCIGYAKAWGYGSLEVVNLFAFRATDPKKLLKASDAIGPENDGHILDACQLADAVVLAWGCHKAGAERKKAVLQLVLSVRPPLCIGVSSGGEPKHPLYLPKTLTPTPFPDEQRTLQLRSELRHMVECTMNGNTEGSALYLRILGDQCSEELQAREQGMTQKELLTHSARRTLMEVEPLEDLAQRAIAGDVEASLRYLRRVNETFLMTPRSSEV